MGGTVQERYAGTNPQMQSKEGMYINKGQTLFYVNDFAVAWGILSFDAAIQSSLRTGMNVTIKTELSDRPIRSEISFIEPSFNNADQKFMQVRAYLPNANRRLRVNSLIEGTVAIPLQQKMIIPSASVFSLGKRMIVWVKTGSTESGKNIFKAREIRVSFMDKVIAVVASGLSPADEVAADAGYLLDSQSLIEQ
jgi:membrane fusion protein, copper/silver efflux system